MDDVEEDDADDFPGVDPPQWDPVIDDDIELPGVDVDAEDAQQIEILDDLDIENFEPEPTVDVQTLVEQPFAPAAQVAPNQSEVVGPRCSERIRNKPSAYKPSMTGSKYAFAVSQLESHGVLHPDAHSFMQEDYAKPSQTSSRP